MKKTMTILEADPGEEVMVSRIEAGRELKQRLAAMGLLPDSKITVVRSVSQGQVIVRLKDSRVVLGRGMANKIFVTRAK